MKKKAKEKKVLPQDVYKFRNFLIRRILYEVFFFLLIHAHYCFVVGYFSLHLSIFILYTQSEFRSLKFWYTHTFSYNFDFFLSLSLTSIVFRLLWFSVKMSDDVDLYFFFSLSFCIFWCARLETCGFIAKINVICKRLVIYFLETELCLFCDAKIFILFLLFASLDSRFISGCTCELIKQNDMPFVSLTA